MQTSNRLLREQISWRDQIPPVGCHLFEQIFDLFITPAKLIRAILSK